MGNAAKFKVLYGEGDSEVLATQAITIQKAGHEVVTAVGRKAVLESLTKGPFDLVILGPTLTRDDRHHLPYMVKKANTTSRVLVLHSDGARHPYVDASVDTGRSIEELLAKIAPSVTKAAVAGK